MAKNLINKYIWILDTIQRYGRITREELNNLWMKSSVSDGEPLARRTFYNYRQGIADTFKVSKKTFKKAVGDLYRRKLITIADDGITLL